MAGPIDTHSHLYPRAYLSLLKARREPPRVVEEAGREYLVLFDEQRGLPASSGLPLTSAFTDPAEKIRFMDSLGIERSIVSVGNPWLDPFGSEESQEMARSINAEMAELEAASAGRIVGMGVLPGGGVDALVDVAGEVANDGRLYGIIVGSRIGGYHLDDPALEDLWATLAARLVPVLIHPHYAAARSELSGFGPVLPVAIGNPFEMTIALARLILAGVLHRHPTLKLIVSHGGGTLPYLAARLDAAWRVNEALHERLPEPPSEALSRLFLDTILFHGRAIRAAADLVGVSRLVFGTDHPFAVADPAGNMAALKEAIDRTDLEEVMTRSAVAIFGLRR